jgi:hypothetical protein
VLTTTNTINSQVTTHNDGITSDGCYPRTACTAVGDQVHVPLRQALAQHRHAPANHDGQLETGCRPTTLGPPSILVLGFSRTIRTHRIDPATTSITITFPSRVQLAFWSQPIPRRFIGVWDALVQSLVRVPES